MVQANNGVGKYVKGGNNAIFVPTCQKNKAKIGYKAENMLDFA
jgi:hypothetical protein